MDGIDPLDLVVSDIEASLAFDRSLLGPLGYVRESVTAGERGERVKYLCRVAGGGRQSNALAGPRDRYAVGTHQIVFTAVSRAVVDERSQWRSAQGARIESSPASTTTGLAIARSSSDPDGIKLEVVHQPAEHDPPDADPRTFATRPRA